MKLNSARQVWHDCTYAPTRGGLSGLAERQMLGVAVQTTDRGITADHAAHSTLCGWFQAAIDKLHPQLRVFGDWMYSATADDDVREAAEEVVLALVLSRAPRMTAAKREKSAYVAAGVLRRYRHMHQGGQSANPDPMANPETFRKWLADWHGVSLPSNNWERDWGGFVTMCFEACEDIDKRALSPIAALMYEMKEAA